MNRNFLASGVIIVLVFMGMAVAPALAAKNPPTIAPALALYQATAVPTTAPTAAPTTAASGGSTAGAGLPAADVEKLVNNAFNTLDRNLALWNIQPGLGTVMVEYGNRFARMYFAGNSGNWDMAKYQLDEMLEIQEVGETTRPARAPMLKAFESNFLAALDKAIAAKDKKAFGDAVVNAAAGCNGCHTASNAATWKSYQYINVQPPKTDPAFYMDWKGGGQDNYVANPPPAATAAPKPALSGTLDAAGVQKLINDKFNAVDRTLALWNIQPGLGTVMIEYGNRFSRLFFSAKAGNWDMAKYQLDEMVEIQEVGETTRPGRSPMLKAFEDNFLTGLNKAVAAKDGKGFDDAYNAAVSGCNGCHAASNAPNWKSYRFVKVQVPTADNNDYVVWKADKGTGSYVANPPVAPTGTPVPALKASLDAAGVQKLIASKFNSVDRSLALWNIQPGLGTVMIEYARRFAQLKSSLDAGNWDMAKYQLDEMVEIQEVGETTRPGRAAMLKAFEDNYLKSLDAAIMAKDKAKATAGFASAVTGCNSCHAASNAANWSSYAYVQIQLPKTDPADYVLWNAPAGTGNYIAPAAATPAPQATSAPTAAATKAAAASPPKMPADHAGRPQCLVCHATGVGGAPKIPADNPNHSAFNDSNNGAMCLGCHTVTK